MKVGFIGLGTMGRPMALNLMKGGYGMAVYARRPETLEPLVARGAASHPTPAALAAECDVIFTMLTATSDVEQVVVGEEGVVDGARRGLLLIDMSTIAPTATRAIAAQLAARGIDMLDAPVSGGPNGAREATLTIMVGGRPEVVERARPLFACLGTMVLHMGGRAPATRRRRVTSCHCS